MKSLFFCSPSVPNGVTFLLNIFLELNVMIVRGLPSTDIRTTWNKVGRRYQIIDQQLKDLSQFLPSLKANTYIFESFPRVYWDHPNSYQTYDHCKTILIARDPRDSLYSWFRRHMRTISNGLDFTNYILQPNQRFNLFIPTINQRLKENSLFFTEYWNSAIPRIKKDGLGDYLDTLVAEYETHFGGLIDGPREDFQVLRFEDFKASPFIAIINLLGQMGLERDREEIKNAILMSSTERAIKHNQFVNPTGIVIRSGTSYEWMKNHAESEAFAMISNRLRCLVDLFGYENLTTCMDGNRNAPHRTMHPLGASAGAIATTDDAVFTCTATKGFSSTHP